MFKLYIEKISSPRDAHDAGRKLALKIAEEKLGYSPEILIGENGKPYINGLHFNISHSHNLVVCAFSDREVGVDVEKVRDYPARVLKLFHPEEISRLEASEDKNLEFFKIWTGKEAYLKCIGTGITKNLSSFNVFTLPNMHVESRDGYVISVCVK